jgi:hypothetical protein
MAKKEITDPKYVAIRQLIYPHVKTGEEVKVEPGRVVKNMSESSLAHEIRDGNVVDANQEDKEKT